MPKMIPWFLVFFLVFTTHSVNAQFVQAVSQRRSSTVKVRAKFGPDWIPGTGFLWKRGDRVVTAFHLVAGSGEITVYSEITKTSHSAHILKVYKSGDLALLALDSKFNVPAFDRWVDYRQDEAVMAIGYRGGQKRMDETKLRVRILGTTLKNIIPEETSKRLKANGFPSLDLKVVNLDGSLLPGHSGCPIINQNGDLVAVGDGGLESGFASASWGIPASKIGLLENSSENASSISRAQVADLFAADYDFSVGGAEISIGGNRFELVRERTLQSAFQTTDDRLGLQQIINQYSMIPGFNPADLRFDIYQDSESGATIVLPHGSSPQTQGDSLWVGGGHGAIEMRLQLKQANPWEIQQMSVIFESLLGVCFLDPASTYLVPITRFDGMTVVRKSMICRNNSQYGFETLVTRGGWFLGSMAINHLYNQWGNADPAHLKRWAKMVISVHLTSFGI